MTPAIPEPLIGEVSGVIRERLGLHFPAERVRELEAALAVVADAFDCGDAAQCAEHIVSHSLGDDELKILAEALTVGETSFFRDPEVFEALEKEILPELIEQRRDSERRLRIWSAGCCTGEEAYTVAMILRRLLPDADEWNLTLLATDINPHFLQRARTAEYGKWSFRRASPWSLRKYVETLPDGRFAIHPAIREMVRFEHLNLAADVYPSVFNNTNAMDVILCRNVLIYFDQPTIAEVVGKLRSCLLPGGWLALGRSERVPDDIDRLRPVVLGDDFWYRRDDRPVADPVAPISVESPPRRIPYPVLLERRYADGDYGVVATEMTAYLQESQPTRPDRRRAMRLLAQAHANLGQLDEAQGWCEQALDEDGLDPRLHYLMASVLLERGCTDEAEASLQRALAADDRFVLAHFALANLVRRQRESSRARQYFERTLSLLRHYRSEEIIPDSEGLTAGRLSEIAEEALLHC